MCYIGLIALIFNIYLDWRVTAAPVDTDTGKYNQETVDTAALHCTVCTQATVLISGPYKVPVSTTIHCPPLQRLPGEDGVWEAAERVRVADEGGRARHAGEGSSLGVSVFTPAPASGLAEGLQLPAGGEAAWHQQLARRAPGRDGRRHPGDRAAAGDQVQLPTQLFTSCC